MSVRVCQGHEDRPPVVAFLQAGGGCVAEGPGDILTPCAAPLPVFLVGIGLNWREGSNSRHNLCSAKSSERKKSCRSSGGCLVFSSRNEYVNNV